MGSMPASVKELLVVLRVRFGDALASTPALLAIRNAYPNARLTVMTDEKRGCVLEHLDFIDRHWQWPKWRLQLASRFIRRQFDLGIVYGDDRLCLKMAKNACKYVVGETNSQHSQYLDLNIGQPASPTHIIRDRMRLAEAVGAPPVELRGIYNVTAQENHRAKHWLESQQEKQSGQFVGLQLASFPTKSCRDWPVENYAELIRKLTTYDNNLNIVLLGGPESAERGQWLTKEFPGQLINAVAKNNFRDNAAIINLMDLYVGPDTGPTHLAGALLRPMVALYHHSPDLLKPLVHNQLTVIAHPQADQPGTNDMSEIDIVTVFNACLNYLGQANSLS